MVGASISDELYFFRQNEITLWGKKHTNLFQTYDWANSSFSTKLDEDCLQAICSRVAEWLVKMEVKEGGGGDGGGFGGDVLTIPAEKTVGEFTIHAELRQRFPDDLWTRFRENGAVDVIKVSKEKRKQLEVEEAEELKDRTLDFLTGFSRVNCEAR